jgi:hypothetical protein
MGRINAQACLSSSDYFRSFLLSVHVLRRVSRIIVFGLFLGEKNVSDNRMKDVLFAMAKWQSWFF